MFLGKPWLSHIFFYDSGVFEHVWNKPSLGRQILAKRYGTPVDSPKQDPGVHFFISHLARWLRTRRFSEPTFRPSGATVFRDFPTFSRICIFFLLFFSPLWSSLFCSSLLWLIPPLLFHLSRLSEVWLLNFLWLALEHARMASMVQSGCCTELLMLTAL